MALLATYQPERYTAVDLADFFGSGNLYIKVAGRQH
jgi:hypothetical protein